MPRVKYLPVEKGKEINISQYPNFSATGSVAGMKNKYYGKDALLVRSGSWIYHVPDEVYDMAK